MTQNTNSKYRLIGKFSLFTLLSIYFLILVGGVVRSTGSGMGCPDWPKCFDRWVPPTEVAQLPENYQDIYAARRARKNDRFAKYLTMLGFDEQAEALKNERVLEEQPFNAFKTWTEYVNRVIGVLVGLFVLITFVLTLPYYKKEPGTFWLGLAALILVIFQGWIGSIVVSTNLITWMVTVHMLIALVILALLTLLVYKTRPHWRKKLPLKSSILRWVLIGCMISLLIQIVLGTQVREMVDIIAHKFDYISRDSWIAELGFEFILHRSFSWIIVLLHGVLLYKFWQLKVRSMLANFLGMIVVLSVITGIIMAYSAIPAILQPVHLLLATIGFGLQFLLFLRIYYPEENSINYAQ